MALELSKINMESMQCKFEHWKESCPVSSFYQARHQNDKASLTKPAHNEQSILPQGWKTLETTMGTTEQKTTVPILLARMITALGHY